MTPSLQMIEAQDRVLVVVAHPDDETFGCGSLIADATAQGAPVTVLCATRGDAGERADDDPRPLATVREEELRSAGAIFGVDEIVVLGYCDSGLEGPVPDGALVSAPLDEIATTIGDWMTRTRATVVIVLEGDDGHRDHLVVLMAARQALAASAADQPRAYAVALPNSLMRRWAAEMAVHQPDSLYLVDVDALGTPDAELLAVDHSAYVATRERAIAAHRSQRSPFEDLSPGLRRDFLATTWVRVLTS